MPIILPVHECNSIWITTFYETEKEQEKILAYIMGGTCYYYIITLCLGRSKIKTCFDTSTGTCTLNCSYPCYIYMANVSPWIPLICYIKNYTSLTLSRIVT